MQHDHNIRFNLKPEKIEQINNYFEIKSLIGQFVGK